MGGAEVASTRRLCQQGLSISLTATEGSGVGEGLAVKSTKVSEGGRTQKDVVEGSPGDVARHAEGEHRKQAATPTRTE